MDTVINKLTTSPFDYDKLMYQVDIRCAAIRIKLHNQIEISAKRHLE